MTGKVVAESTQAPLPGASIELWSASGLVARAASDANGAFVLSGPARAGTMRLLVRRVGFAPATVDSVADGSSRIVALRALAVSLPEVVVTTCPGPDDTVSRQLWLAMTLRYRLAPDTPMIYAGLGYQRGETVTADSVGFSAHEEWSGKGGLISLGGSRAWRRQISRFGYAVPRGPGTYMGSDEGAVEYIPLDAHAAEHFVDSLFGALHVFLTAHFEDDLVVIPFCARTTRRPDIEGELSLVPGGGLVGAWWRFVVRKDEEQAGGQVFFAPPADSGPGFAIPIRGVFWRRRPGSSRYWQRLRVYEGWGDWNWVRQWLRQD